MIRVIWVDAALMSAPTPSPSSTLNLTASNYSMAAGFVVASLVVVVIALVFAFGYHSKLLSVFQLAVKRGLVKPSTVNDTVIAQLENAPPTQQDDKSEGVPAPSIVITLPTTGTHTVVAAQLDSAGVGGSVARVAGAKDQEEVAPQSVAALPFAIRNWGRLVVVIFGIGVVAALMALRVLDSAAGAGILGTLLGVGAVAATSGDGKSSTS